MTIIVDTHTDEAADELLLARASAALYAARLNPLDVAEAVQRSAARAAGLLRLLQTAGS